MTDTTTFNQNDDWDTPVARMKRGRTRAGAPRKRCQCSCGRFVACESPPCKPGHGRYPCLECCNAHLDHRFGA